MRERKDVELDVRRGKEDLGGVVRGETKIRIHCMKNFILNNVKDFFKSHIGL